MADYATNIFHAITANKEDLFKMEAFLKKHFSGIINRYGEIVDAAFTSLQEYPEEKIAAMVEALEDKDKICIKILTYEFGSEYVSFRIFSQGKWNVKI